METQNNNREIEVRFLDIDKDTLIKKLHLENAEDLGDDFLTEIIFYDKDLQWQRNVKKFVRLRNTKNGAFMTFKHHQENSATGTKEIELSVGDFNKTKDFLEEIGLIAFRQQEKKRHTFKLDGVVVDIDTWPSIPAYVELEGQDEESLKKVASRLGLDWAVVVLESPRFIIEKRYNIPVSDLHFFTFDRIE